jgi:uncharacterized RDD family membrane protein YckC
MLPFLAEAYLCVLTPKTMQEAHVLDTPIEQKELAYAGFWIRAVAYIIDGVILTIGLAAAAFVFVDLFASNDSQVIIFFVMFIGVVVYFPLMESSSKQATLGKLVVGIRVGNSQGEPISFLNAVGRLFAKYLSALPFYIGFMMAGWDSKCQTIHDKLASTYVFYARP